MKMVCLRVLAAVGLTAGATGLFCVAYGLVDIRDFEWSPLWRMFGPEGVAFSAFMVAGLTVFTGLSANFMLQHRALMRPPSRLTTAFLVTWLCAILWLCDWIFLEVPLTSRWTDQHLSTAQIERVTKDAVKRFTADGSLDALTAALPVMDRSKVAVMLSRISLNRPSVFNHVSIGAAIAEYAARYSVSPVLLLSWCYIDSFYGEAPAGPMPFFAEINGEMFRDLVQAHLPWWFIENPARVALIEGPYLDMLLPPTISFKLRYAFQKATYDIAIAPYMNSVMSDLFLILSVYPAEFPELFGAAMALNDPLSRSFLAIRDDGLLKPYHDPLSLQPMDNAYYTGHRDALITFGRAAVYRLTTDFGFATKVQALVARYYSQQFRERLESGQWDELSEQKQTSLLAMLRDVYTPNVGHLSYNLYIVPELNTTPIVFLSGAVRQQFADVADKAKTWTPSDSAKLWGSTGLMLRVLSESWSTVSGAPLAGVHPADTLDDARRVLARYQ